MALFGRHDSAKMMNYPNYNPINYPLTGNLLGYLYEVQSAVMKR